jgi:hypothetical protein
LDLEASATGEPIASYALVVRFNQFERIW